LARWIFRDGGEGFGSNIRRIRVAPSEPSKQELIAPIAAQAAGSAAPTARIAELERRLRFNSLNSSKPPSRDRLKKPARTFQRTAGQAKKSQGRTPLGRSPIIAPRPVLDAARRPETNASTPKCRPCFAGWFSRLARSCGMAGKRYAGDVCGDPRTLHACHAGKEALFLGRRDLLTLSFSRSVTSEASRRRRSRAQNASKHQNRRRNAATRLNWASAPRAPQNGLKILLGPTRPRYPKTHRGFWVALDFRALGAALPAIDVNVITFAAY